MCEKQGWLSAGEAVTPHLDPDEGTHASGKRAEGLPIESIYGIGRRYSEALRGIGVETVGDVAAIEKIGEFEELLGIPAKVLRRIRLRALSYISGEVLQTEPIEFPGEKLIYLDIETDERCSRVWLIGLLVDGRFTQFYAEGWTEEKQILERFLSFLETHRGYTLVSYSGTGFDYRVTLNATKRHELDSTPLEEFPHVDLCTLLRRSFIFPHHSYGLKELGAYMSYQFRQTELDGLAVARAYQRHVDHDAPLGAEVLEYNEDDVRVVRHLFEKCFRLRKHTEGLDVNRVGFHGGWVYLKTRLDPWLG